MLFFNISSHLFSMFCHHIIIYKQHTPSFPLWTDSGERVKSCPPPPPAPPPTPHQKVTRACLSKIWSNAAPYTRSSALTLGEARTTGEGGWGWGVRGEGGGGGGWGVHGALLHRHLIRTKNFSAVTQIFFNFIMKTFVLLCLLRSQL